MKKIVFGASLAILSVFSSLASANGLKNLIVEKYYVSNANDSIKAAAQSAGVLPVGSVTYRLFAKMAPGYKLKTVYGSTQHPLKITSSTTFFNDESNGAGTPYGYKTSKYATDGALILDSYFTMGATAQGQVGVLKTVDNNGSLVSSNTMDQNADVSAGIPIKTEDGMIPGSAGAMNFVGFDPSASPADASGIFAGTSQMGGSFVMTSGAWACLNGTTGLDTTNTVMIGQFTTTGVFGFELNVQVQDAGGNSELYVARNAGSGETKLAALLLAPHLPPVVTLTAPTANANIYNGVSMPISATVQPDTNNAAHIDSVAFFVDGKRIGKATATPYTFNYTMTVGAHTVSAKAYDNFLNNGSASTSVTGIAVPAPTVSLTAPATATQYILGDTVVMTATATVANIRTLTNIQFQVDGQTIATVSSTPYTAKFKSTLGGHTLTAIATDNASTSTTSAAVSINVINNTPPTVTITSPSAGLSVMAPSPVTFTATASSTTGSIAKVEFFVNGHSVGVASGNPYTLNWTSVIGNAAITAVATDNRGTATTSSVVNISVADPNALPYAITNVTATCLPTSFCLPITAADTVKNVIGYDMVLKYDSSKVTPTGTVTVSNALINPSYVTVIDSIDAAHAQILISLVLNGNSNANTQFAGKGQLACVQFNKKANFAYVDTAKFTMTSLQESYINGVAGKPVQAGYYDTYKDSVFNGSLKFWADASPIRYNTALPNKYLATDIYGVNGGVTSTFAYMPDTAGKFVYSTSHGSNIEIDRDVLASTNVQPVINGFDAALTRRVLIGDAHFTPSVYQMIAMDVNMDGVISAGDASQINQRTVLVIPEFKQAWNYSQAGVSNGKLSKDWLFVGDTLLATAAYKISATFPANDGVGYSKSKVPTVPFTVAVPIANANACPQIFGTSYTGIMVGDVDGNYAKQTPNGTIMKMAPSSDKVVFDLAAAQIKNGYIDVPVAVNYSSELYALDFALQYNENVLKFNSVRDLTGSLVALANYNQDDKTLRFTSSNLEPINVNNSLVSVRFEFNGTQLNATDLNSMEGYLNGNRVAAEVKSGAMVVNADQLTRVYPNPAAGQINVEVSERSLVQMFDLTGKLVMSGVMVNANERQTLNTENLQNGIYMIQISNDNFVKKMKVVVNQ